MGYDGARGGTPRLLRAISLRWSSSCFAFRLRSSVASSSLFYSIHQSHNIPYSKSKNDILVILSPEFSLHDSPFPEKPLSVRATGFPDTPT